MNRQEKFESKGTTQKGEYFEQIVRDWLWERGHRPTRPAHNGAHAIDMFVIDKAGKVFAIDAKAKASRRSFADTGIDYRHFNVYFDIEKNANIDVWVFFGDHISGDVYGATLADLRAPKMNPPGCKPGMYPRIEGQIIYFPLSNMSKLFSLSDKQCAALRELTKKDEKQCDMFGLAA